MAPVHFNPLAADIFFGENPTAARFSTYPGWAGIIVFVVVSAKGDFDVVGGFSPQGHDEKYYIIISDLFLHKNEWFLVLLITC